MGTPIAKRALFRPKKTKTKVKPIGSFDVETDGLGGAFIVSAICDKNGDVSYQFDVENLVSALLSRKNRDTLFYAHNGGNYDFKYLFRTFFDMKERGELYEIKTLYTQNKFIALKIYRSDKDKNPLTIYDSYALLPSSLYDITSKFAPEYKKMEKNFNNEKFDILNDYDMEYLKKDVQGLKYALERFCEILSEHFGIVPNVSAASTAMKAFKQTIPEDQIYFRTHKKAEEFIRKAYYGGMVYIKEVLTAHTDMVKLDISGAYGYAMKNFDMPVGQSVYTKEYEKGKIGFYRVKVIAPKQLDKYMVPVRSKTGVIWARGTFETYIDSYTLEYARKLGYKIEVIEGYFFLYKKNIFREFIEKCEAIEFANKGNALGDVAKLMRNSLYGKFGTNPHKTEYMLGVGELDEGWYPVPDEDGFPHEFLSARNVTIEAGYIMPHWAACITALVRIYLYDIDATLEHTSIYNDTDSTVVPREVYEKHKDKLENRNVYGKLKIEEEYASFFVRGAKAYIGERVTPKIHPKTKEELWYDMKAKGIPYREVTPELIYNGGEVTFTSLNGIIPIISQGIDIAVQRHRKVTDIHNSGSWTVLDDGYKVLPLEMRI